jgi:hypothetical protein
MPFTSYPQVVQVLRCLHTLTTLRDPAWDRAAVRKVVDLIPTLDRIIGTFEQLQGAAALTNPEEGDDEAFSRRIAVFRNMKTAWQGELANMDPEIQGGREASEVDNLMPLRMNFDGTVMMCDTFDIFWE